MRRAKRIHAHTHTTLTRTPLDSRSCRCYACCAGFDGRRVPRAAGRWRREQWVAADATLAKVQVCDIGNAARLAAFQAAKCISTKALNMGQQR